MKYALLRISFLLCIFAINLYTISGQSATWQGGNGSWTDFVSWDCFCVPTAAHFVSVPSGVVTIPPGTNAMAEHLWVSFGASVVNDDSLHINAPSSDALQVAGTFTNNGYLEILGTPTNGVHVDNGLMENYGTLNMPALEANTGIWVDGTFNVDTGYFKNYGSIIIDIPLADKIGIIVAGPGIFENENSGIIDITMLNSLSSRAVTVNNPDQMINRGTMNLTGGELGGSGRFVNYGSLNHHHPVLDPGTGIRINTFINEVTGNVSIKYINTSAFIFNDTLINRGSIVVDSTGGDALSTDVGDWRNEGYLEIRRAGRFGLVMGNSNDVFRNEKNATLVIRRAQNSGIDLFGSGTHLYNNGHIIIDSVGLVGAGTTTRHGINFTSNSSILNDTCGIIDISNVDEKGILKNSGVVSENYGTININSTGSAAFHPAGNAHFFNKPGGKITITNSGGHGLAVTQAGFFGNAFFTNQGVIDVKAPIANFSIYNNKTFINDTCGVIYVDHAMRNQSGTWSNYGFMHASNTTPHNFFGSNGKNFGVIEDLYDQFTDPQFINERIVISPVDGGVCTGDTLHDFLKLDVDSLSSFEIPGVFVNADLSTSAGTYDPGLNVCILNNDGKSAASLFIHLNNTIKSCQDTMQMNVVISVTCPVLCSTGPHVWTDCGATSDWTDPDNWSRGTVPGAADDVVIPDGVTAPSVQESTTIGTLQLMSGAQINVANGVVLIVSG